MIQGSFRSYRKIIRSMSTLLEKQITVNRIVTTSVKHARAIEDPARAKIVEILYRSSTFCRPDYKCSKKGRIQKSINYSSSSSGNS